jgi:hypothetical protein
MNQLLCNALLISSFFFSSNIISLTSVSNAFKLRYSFTVRRQLHANAKQVKLRV